MTPLTPLVAPASGASPFAAAGDAAQSPALTAAQQRAFAREFSRAQSLTRQESSAESAAEAAATAATAASPDASGDIAHTVAQGAEARPVPAPIQALRELLQRVTDDSARDQAGIDAEPATTSASGVSVGAAVPPAAPAAASGAAADAAGEAVTETESIATDRASADAELRASNRREAALATHEARPALPPVDPSIVVRDLGALQPELREKVERVVARMKEEHGLDVSVAETWRGQPRQEHLYEQGRSRAGEVVTWTRHSRHTEGRAADLIVTGPASADGYRLLSQVARQEGLQTLGVRDPGHVELAVASRDGSSVLPGAPRVMEMGIAGVATLPGAAAVAPVASVASVATIAPVAPVASVAAVAPLPGIRSAVGAQTGDARSSGRTSRSPDGPSVSRERGPAVAADAQTATRQRVVSPGSAGASEVFARTGRSSRDERRSAPLTREAAETASGGSPLSARAAYAAASPTAWPVSAAPAAGGPQGIDTTARIAQVTGLQDARSALPVSHMMLHLDTPDGGVDRVRVALRGARVGATIELHDGESAAGLSRRLPELIAALESRGLESGHLRVQPTTGHDGTTLADLVRATVGDASAARGTLFASSESQFSRSRDNEPGGHTQQESPRHRSRREQKDSTR